MWLPSIIIVVGAGLVDLSSLTAPKSYVLKIDCERAVSRMVEASRAVYPNLRITFAACVNAK